MADGLVLASAQVRPTRLGAIGFRFRHPTLEQGLRAAMGGGVESK
jgi:NAD dependent epimerase/dehydratase family enzyme